MTRLFNFVSATLLLLVCNSAFATLNVLACEPEWGALARELGGDKVSARDATNAFQDPHRIEAKPSLIAQARKADLLICTGTELEIGWLPLLLRQSGNPAIQPGQPGYFEAALLVKRLEVPTRMDRADGDVHPGGNPHIQTDPRNIRLVADALSKRLAEIDSVNTAYYQQRQADFAQRWQAAIQRWEAQAAPLKGTAIVVQHRGFPYLSNWLGLQEVATLESKPGMEPSSAYLASVLETLKQKPARMVVRAAYNHERPSRWLAERTAIKVVELPYTVGGSPQANDLFGLFDDTIHRLLEGLK